MDYDATNIAQTYDRGRDHGPAFLEQWMKVVSANVDENKVRDILDLGCGTGRFSQGLASRFSANVIGIDPSRKMLAQAREKSGPVWYAAGFAELLPLRANSIDLIFASMVYHHFKDPRAVAQECHRVLRPGGCVCIRTGTVEQISNYPYVPFFPAARAILEDVLPSVTSIRAVFERASFRTLFAGVLVQEIATDYLAYAEKLACGADSVLARLDQKEFAAGLEALRSKQREADSGRAVVEPIDFVVFEKER